MKQLNWYQIFGNTHKIPDGRTVEPTDDIQIWLHCADIWDKTYTKLAEVLADTDTLSALMASENAVDYMVRSTAWAVPITVPAMTSDTTPSGVASASACTSCSAYNAFDGALDSVWQVNNGGQGGYVQYMFDSPVNIVACKLITSSDSGNSPRVKDYTIKGSNDGIEWSSPLAEGTIARSTATEITEDITLDNAEEYLFYRVTVTTYTTAWTVIRELQFYSASVTTSADAMTYIGQNNYCANTLLADATWCNAICNSEYFESVLNVKVPVMTSNTTPSGVASGTSKDTSGGGATYDYYKAFDGNNSTAWAFLLAQGTNPQRLVYDFGSAQRIHKATVYQGTTNTTYFRTSYKYQGSNDGITWVDLATETSGVANQEVETILDSSQEYQYYAWYSSNGGGYLNTLQFYGRKDV